MTAGGGAPALRAAAADRADTPAGVVERRLVDRVLGWRDRLVGSERFRSWAAAFWPTRPIARREARALFDLCAGFVHSQVLLAVVELKLLDLVAESPRSATDLASRLGLPEASCRRLLDAAVGLRLLSRRRGGRYGLGMRGAALRGLPGVAAMVRHHPVLYGDLADPVALLRRGGGEGALAGYWPYAAATGAVPTADAVAPYSALMAASQPLVADEVLAAYPFGRHRALLDIGAGDGAFLSAVARQAPGLKLTAFDLPAVAELARARFAREGLADRAEAIGGDVFADALPEGHDLVSLVRVVHDHDDAAALAILRAACRALTPGGTLLVAEPLADGHGAEAYFAFYFLAMGSGRLRSADELAAMMREAGFAEIRSVPVRSPLMTGLLTARKSTDKPT